MKTKTRLSLSQGSILAVTILTASLLSAGSPANAADEVTAPVPGLTDSAKMADARSVASGTLYSSKGKSVGAGKLVTLIAWPGQNVLSQMQVGETVKTVPVGFAYTKDDGSFDMKVSDARFVDRYATDEGIVNYEVQAVVDGEVSAYHFSGVTDGSAENSLARTSKSAQAYVGAVSVSAPKIQLRPIGDSRLKSAAAAENLPLEDVDLSAVDPSIELPKACATTLRQNLGSAWVTVGEAYALPTGKVAFTYKKGSSSSLGVASSASGSKGSFTSSGEATVSSTIVQNFDERTSRSFFNTQFRFGKYETVCLTAAGQVTSRKWTVRANAYVGGKSNSTPKVAIVANYCSRHNGGSTEIDDSTAYTMGGAATIAALGVTLSGRTGFNQSTNLKFTFSKPMQLCGSHDYEGGTPRRLRVKDV